MTTTVDKADPYIHRHRCCRLSLFVVVAWCFIHVVKWERCSKPRWAHMCRGSTVIHDLLKAVCCCNTNFLNGVDGRNQDLLHDVVGLGCSCRLLLRRRWQCKLLLSVTLLRDVLIPLEWVMLLWVVVTVVCWTGCWIILAGQISHIVFGDVSLLATLVACVCLSFSFSFVVC